MAMPAVAGMITFVFVPFAIATASSFTNQRLVSPVAPRFVGLDNYGRILQDSVFWQALLISAVVTFTLVLVQGGLGLVLALLVNQRLRGVSIARTAYFVPVVTAMPIVAVIWSFVFTPSGLLNGGLSILPGLSEIDIAWLRTTQTALFSVLVVTVWQGVGIQMLFFLGGLQTIPRQLYEAAEIDGAGPGSRFRHVTMPGLRTITALVVITLTIFSFRLFAQIDILTGGGPSGASTTLFYLIFRTGFSEQNIGYASAMIVVLCAIVVGTVIILRRVLPSDED